MQDVHLETFLSYLEAYTAHTIDRASSPSDNRATTETSGCRKPMGLGTARLRPSSIPARPPAFVRACLVHSPSPLLLFTPSSFSSRHASPSIPILPSYRLSDLGQDLGLPLLLELLDGLGLLRRKQVVARLVLLVLDCIVQRKGGDRCE